MNHYRPRTETEIRAMPDNQLHKLQQPCLASPLPRFSSRFCHGVDNVIARRIGCVAARSREACDEAAADRITNGRENDGDGVRLLQKRGRGGCGA